MVQTYPTWVADYHPHQTIAANSELLRELTCIDFQIEPCFSQPRGARIRGGPLTPDRLPNIALQRTTLPTKKEGPNEISDTPPAVTYPCVADRQHTCHRGRHSGRLDRPVLETQSYSLPVQSFADPPTDAEVADAMQITRDAGWVSAVAASKNGV